MTRDAPAPPLARALYDAYRALPARERAAFDRLMQGTPNPSAPVAATRSPKEKTGAALTEEAFAEVRTGGGTRYASFADLVADL